MRRSDVFESFVKIALEKGLISESAEQTEKTLDNPRWDSLSADEIAKLYNNKSEGYKRNIIEQAHPESTVIAPSYDKLHGLVENENERQDITLNIIMQEPEGGHLNQKKYAEKELIMSLVRIGNDLDNRNQEELRALADHCLLQASALKKEAVAFLAIAIPVALVLGAFYAYEHITSREGLNQDNQKLQSAIQGMMTSTGSIVGFKFTDQFVALLKDLSNKSNEVYNLAHALDMAVGKTDIPKTAKEAIALAQDPAGQEIAKAYQALKEKMDDYAPYFATMQRNLSDDSFMQRNIADKGKLTEWAEDLGLEGENWYNIVSTPFGELRRSLGNFVKDVQNLEYAVQQGQGMEQQVKQDMQQAPAPQPDIKPMPDMRGAVPSQQTPTQQTPAQTGPLPVAQEGEKAPWDDIKVPGSLSELLG